MRSLKKTLHRTKAEGIEWFVEDLAFSLSYDMAPHPPPPPFSKLSLFLSLPVCRLSSLQTGEGGEGG